MERCCVLIPVHNEELVLDSTLNSLYYAGYKRQHIFIVDDASTDQTVEVAKQHGVNVYQMPDNGGKAAAQRAGLEEFQLLNRYDWVVFIDGDTRVDQRFKESMDSAISDNPDASLFIGQVTAARDDHVFSALRAMEYTLSHELIKKGQDNFNVVYVSPGCASVYSTSILSQLELASDLLAEDMDLTMQVHRLNGQIVYVHDAKVITQDPSTLSDFHRQIMRWYRGFWQVALKHRLFSLEKKSPVEVYMLYLILDSLVLNRAFVIIFCLIFLSLNTLLVGLIADLVIVTLISAYSAYKLKRLDVLLKLPMTYTLSFLNMYAYIRSFVEVVILRKKKFGWNKVKRYIGDKDEEIRSGPASGSVYAGDR